MKLIKTMSKIHRYAAYIVVLPFALILLTGIILLLRKDLPFMSGGDATFKVERFVSIEDVFSEMAKRGVSAEDIKTVALRKSKGLYTVTDSETIYSFKADTLALVDKQSANSSFRKIVFRIHEGTIGGDLTLYFIWLPTAIALLFLSGSGIYFLTLKRRK